jgi:hypothetical protein
MILELMLLVFSLISRIMYLTLAGVSFIALFALPLPIPPASA